HCETHTPFGAFLGSLQQFSATELAVLATKAAIAKSQLMPTDIDQAIFGNVLQTSLDAPYLARHVALKSGLRQKTTALTLNRLCGSGFQSILTAAEQILLGQAHLVVAGGTENMSSAPYVMYGFRNGYRLGQGQAFDSLQSALTDSYNGLAMGITAEKLAQQFQISREESDAFSFASQQKVKRAYDQNLFEEEIVPIEIARKKEKYVMCEDEHPRPQTTMKSLSALMPVFDPNGIVTAGSSSGIVDGAACVVVASKHEVNRRGIPYLGKIISHGISGCDPDYMGLGPVEASQKALLCCGKTFKDMDLIDINEAFAPQTLSVIKRLGLTQDKVNVNGGAIAIGHPLAASGTRITLHALLELKRRNKRYALVTACIGGGQGIALVLENDQF
ncbi:MAG: acetyl-CoA C-acyltransferase, partial [Bdellovibrionales bacterium]|nr:acetyl-CoA C-acyltransferase [Bdellovibrionales bacterium]